MIDVEVMAALLDSLKDPLLLADTEHVTRYMNRAGLETGGKPVLLHSSMRIIRGTEFWRRRSLVLVRIRGLARAVSGALQRTSLMNCVRLGTWWGSRLVMSS